MNDEPPVTKKGPTALGVGLIALCVLAIVALMVWQIVRSSYSPEAVTTALRGPKKDYVGSWEGDGVDLSLDATGYLSYGDSRPGPRHNEDATGQIEAFDRDDIVFSETFRIEVTSAPHRVGDHFEMTANGASLKRER